MLQNSVFMIRFSIFEIINSNERPFEKKVIDFHSLINLIADVSGIQFLCGKKILIEKKCVVKIHTANMVSM